MESLSKRYVPLLLFLWSQAEGRAAGSGLANPAHQSLFATLAPNPLDPSFVFNTTLGEIEVTIGEGVALTGLVDASANPLETPIWGYGGPLNTGLISEHQWPGPTFIVESDEPLRVHWKNKFAIEKGYLLTGKDNTQLGFEDYSGRSVVDTSFHWAYSISGYENYTIEEHGTPVVPHLHGGHTDASFDGNPEYFFSPDFGVKGPQWKYEKYLYANSQPAAMLWYHDHALGITRLNINSGLAGFYLIRDDQDTGKPDNRLTLPTFPYEIALLVQDRMFKEDGQLFYPSFPGDPRYSDYIMA